jgi:hypothetical protein
VPPERKVAARSGLATRLKRAAAFVAIVWGVAASFVAFELAALRGMNLALAYPELFGGVLLSRAVSDSTSCVTGPEDGGDRSQPDAPASSFALGVGVGREAVFRQWATTTPEAIGPLTVAVQQAAGELGVSFPGSFAPHQLANAHREYVAWIEADGRGTARQLADRYSPRTCHAYKLGAVWGYSEVVRMALPAQRAALAVEIRHYARQIPLPEELWRPMLEPAGSPAGSAELEAEMAALSAQVLAFLREQRPPP